MNCLYIIKRFYAKFMKLHSNPNILSGIKNVIFDLGGVILNIDYQRTIERFKKLGINDFDKIYSQFKQTDLFDKYDKGLVQPKEFRERLTQFASQEIDDADFDNAWNAMLLDIPEERIEVLKKIRKHFNTYLLSNTNEIHLEFFFNYIKQAHGINNFEELFNKVYYSCRIEMRKPDLEIYQKVLNDNKLNPEETLFIDDTKLNTDAAISIGIRGCYLNNGIGILDIFSDYK